MPIIASLAGGSARGFGGLRTFGAVADTGAMFPLGLVQVGSTTSSITFSSIPATYTHLQVRAMIRNTRTSDRSGSPAMRFNGDTGSNYYYHRIYGDGDSAGTDTSGGTTNQMYAIGMATDLNTAGIFGLAIWDILDYTNTNKNKIVKVLAGMDNNRTSDVGSVGITSGAWNNTNAITSITILPNVNDWSVGSTFYLYGIKGSL
jgi:hypothetical protein